jgi:hypothetical protein
MHCPIASRHTRAARARRILAGLGALIGLTSCVGGQLDPRAQRALDVFECYVAAIEPHLGGVCDVAELVRDAIAGRADLPKALVLVGATQDDLAAVNSALVACRGAAETVKAPAVNPRTLAFRDPPW